MGDRHRAKPKSGQLKGLSSRDHDVFAQLVERYQQDVVLCCRTIGLSETDIEDVASETFLAAYRGFARFEGKSQLSTWLWSIAYKRAVSHLRKNKRFRELFVESEVDPVDRERNGPLQSLETAEQNQNIWNAVEQLPRLWSLAVILFYREGKTVAEIAKITHINQGTVKTYLFKGRKKLKEMLCSIVGEDNHG